GVVPVRCRNDSSVSARIRDRSLNVIVKQVSLIPAFALTTETCQGLTVDRLEIGPLRHSTLRKPQRASCYIAVTRVRSMDELYLMESLALEH
ncbi:hypothetical protein L914_17332, partial [Phytophthora nicotianae]